VSGSQSFPRSLLEVVEEVDRVVDHDLILAHEILRQGGVVLVAASMKPDQERGLASGNDPDL